MTVFYLVLALFVGYLAGRWSHYWLNPAVENSDWAPDHWIYGLLLMTGGVYWGRDVGWWVAAFGLGFFVSDLKDFMHGKWIGADDLSKPPKF